MCRLPADLEVADATEQHESRARAGTPIPLIEIRARSDDGRLIPCHDQALGKLEIRGPWVAAVYLRGTGGDKFTDDGWFRTGDVVRINERGCMRICSRAMDLVKSGGEWIASAELENQLMTHSPVAEAAVIAIPDERWAERPLAAVVLRGGLKAVRDELRAHLGSNLGQPALTVTERPPSAHRDCTVDTVRHRSTWAGHLRAAPPRSRTSLCSNATACSSAARSRTRRCSRRLAPFAPHDLVSAVRAAWEGWPLAS